MAVQQPAIMLLFYIYAVLLVSFCFQAQRALAEVTCVKENNCRCTLNDGTKRFFDLSEISSSDEPYFQEGDAGDLYYYDPCVPFTESESADVCKDVAGCHEQIEDEESSYTAIALHNRVVFNYNEEGLNLILNYDNGGSGSDIIILSVILNCNKDITKDVMEITQSTDTAYQFLIESPIACIQTPGGGGGKQGLSAGSILCIIFSVAVFVYFVGGFIFMAIVQHKSGREAIPNHDFWIQLPGLIKEGASFSVSCVTNKGGSSSAPIPEDQDGSDAFGGDGGGGSSTGNTKYDAI